MSPLPSTCVCTGMALRSTPLPSSGLLPTTVICSTGLGLAGACCAAVGQAIRQAIRQAPTAAAMRAVATGKFVKGMWVRVLGLS